MLRILWKICSQDMAQLPKAKKTMNYSGHEPYGARLRYRVSLSDSLATVQVAPTRDQGRGSWQAAISTTCSL